MNDRARIRCGNLGPDGRHLVGDPIDVVTGSNRDVFFEFELPGPVPVVWRRHYDSAANDIACALGWGHAHSFEHELVFDLDGLRYHGPLHRTATFPLLAREGDSLALDGWRLTRTGPTRYLLSRNAQPSLEFNFAGDAWRSPLAAVVVGRHRLACRYDEQGLLERLETRERALFLQHDSTGRLVGVASSDSPSQPARPLVSYGYDAMGNLVTGEDAYGQGFSFGYDAERRMTRKTDRRGYTFEWTYDAAGRCIHSRGEDGVHEVWLHYESDAQRTIVRRADGGEWIYGYDENGVVTTITDPYGCVLEYVLGPDGRVAEEIDGTGASTRWAYDPAGALTGRVTPQGKFVPARAGKQSVTRSELRHRGRPVGWEWGRLSRWFERAAPADTSGVASLPTAIAGQLDAMATDRSEPVSQNDHSGRLAGHRLGDGWQRRFAYDPNGNVRRIIDADGQSFLYDYDSWDFWTGATDATGRTMSMGWTPSEQLAVCIDGGGSSSEYRYDLKDRLTEVRRHGGTYVCYDYDAGDRVIAGRDGSGMALWRAERDANGRVVALTLTSGAELTYGYTESGRPAAAACTDGETSIEWHTTGRRKADLHDGAGVEHAFDEHGSIRATTFLGRFTVQFRRSSRHGCVVRDPLGVDHRVALLRTDVPVRSFGGGLAELSQYRADGRCVMRALWMQGGRVAWTLQCEYSNEGDLLVSRDALRGTTRFGYDAAHRLTTMIGPDGSSHEFRYDKAGNLVQQPGLAGVRLDEGNRIATANGDTFLHDDRLRIGERRSRAGVTTLTYDEMDMLRSIHAPGLEWSAGYDAFRRRVSQTVNGQTTRYRWDGDRLAAELHAGGGVRLYVYVDPDAVTPFLFIEYDDIDAPPESARVYGIHSDHRATPVLVTNPQGEVVWRAHVEPYGRVHVDAGATIDMPLRFPGHYHDAVTGLHYNRNRYYSPELGRYLQPDPIGQGGGVNVYAYPANPLKRVDMRGLCPKEEKPGDGTDIADDEPTLVNQVPPTMREPEPHHAVDPHVALVDGAIKGDAIRIDGGPEFHAGVRADLENMAGTPSGAATINAIVDNRNNQGTVVTIAPMRPGDHQAQGGLGPHCEWSGTDPRVGPKGQPGTPTDSTIRYTPGQTLGSKGGSPSDSILNHEANHAANNGAGENMSNHPPGNPRNGNAEEGNVIKSDNQYREDRGGAANGYPPRDGWDHLP